MWINVPTNLPTTCLISILVISVQCVREGGGGPVAVIDAHCIDANFYLCHKMYRMKLEMPRIHF